MGAGSNQQRTSISNLLLTEWAGNGAQVTSCLGKRRKYLRWRETGEEGLMNVILHTRILYSKSRELGE